MKFIPKLNGKQSAERRTSTAMILAGLHWETISTFIITLKNNYENGATSEKKNADHKRRYGYLSILRINEQQN